RSRPEILWRGKHRGGVQCRAASTAPEGASICDTGRFELICRTPPRPEVEGTEEHSGPARFASRLCDTLRTGGRVPWRCSGTGRRGGPSRTGDLPGCGSRVPTEFCWPARVATERQSLGFSHSTLTLKPIRLGGSSVSHCRPQAQRP